MAERRALLLLIDANALVHRSFHALRKEHPLTVRRTGERVEAVYGFVLTLFKVLKEFKPTHLAVAFDLPAPTFRHTRFIHYKEKRPKTPSELISQLQRARELTQAFNIPVFETEGYEADDVLGTIAQQASTQGTETVIVTGDADALQLVSAKVKVLMPQRNLRETILYDEIAVKQKYGIGPQQVPDLKGLRGDPSDNIPGIPGIGEKTAVKLLQQFVSLEGVYQSLDKITPDKLRETLGREKETAWQSKELATIVTNIPLNWDIHACELSSYDRDKVLSLFRELEFFSLLGRLPDWKEQEEKDFPPARVSLTPDKGYNLVNTPEAFNDLLGELSSVSSFVLDLLTVSGESGFPHLVGIALSPAAGKAYYLPLGHTGLQEEKQLHSQQVLEHLRPLLENSYIAKIAHDGKEDIATLTIYKIQLANLSFDTMIAAYLLGDKSLGLPALALARLGVELPSFVTPGNSGKKQPSLAEMSISVVTQQACHEVDTIHRLHQVLKTEVLEQGLEKLFAEVEMPLIPVLSSMERNGVTLDTKVLRQMSQSLREQISRLEREIYESVGHEFNINSPQQLSAIIFAELKLPHARKTKSGYSTDASVLEGLKGLHPVIPLIQEFRQLIKIKSTYIDALPALINPRTRRVHTSFNQTATTTGRLSSSNPNLQNIPVRGELGKQIRRAFISESLCWLLGGDYSQIDLRVLAHLSQDPRLLEAFQKGEDIHSATASWLFGVPLNKVTPDMRRMAKTVNFGVIYGMSAYGLEQATELSREEAIKFINSYFEQHPKVREYLESTKEKARQLGYVQTILGRRRYIPEINSPNQQIKESAERMAINMPVQGASADIIKIAMVKIHQEMGKRGLSSKMILQVHDELLFEVPPEELEEMTKLVQEVMPQALELSVPLKVEVKVGKNWGEME